MTAYLRPADLDEALAARRCHPDHLLLAGGTDLLVGARERPAPPGVIDLFGLPGLTTIAEDADGRGAIRLGAAVSYSALLRSALVADQLPALHACAREVGALQIQERGTIGGNVATSSPVGDTLPVLLVLDASIELAGPAGRRLVSYRDFCTGYRRTALAADEIISAIVIPAPVPGTRQFWRKVGTRRAQSISKVMAAGSARLDDVGRLVAVRWALGAVAERPIRLPDVEQLLEGESPSPALAREAAEIVHRSITPITDPRSTASYRREIASRLTARFVLSITAGER